MRFANYKFSARKVNNLGDNLQIIAIDNIYKQMGIDLNDVVYIDMRDLSTYNDEYVVLPISFPLVDYIEGGIAKRFSSHIIPVFLGFTMVKQTLTIEEINYLKRFEPIGCRDEYTLLTMRKYGIDSYLNGCITITLPKRRKPYNANKVFIVDVNKDIYNKIPDKIKSNASLRTHFRKDKLINPKDEAKKQYQEYKDNASLVVTALLHCAIPCVAAGIPVILLRNNISFRMSWVEKFLSINTIENIDSINWDPPVIDLENIKKMISENAMTMLRNTFNKYEHITNISWYYETRNKRDYVNEATIDFVRFISNEWKDSSKQFKYSFWGLTQASEWIYDYIKENYSNAKLCHVYDSYRSITFNGIQSEKPDKIIEYEDEYIFVTTIGAADEARVMFSRINKPDNRFFIMKSNTF